MNIKDLTDHLKKHKDTVIILGSNATKEFFSDINDDEFNKYMNKRMLVRKPKQFWDYYNNNIFIDPDTKVLNSVQLNIERLFNKDLLDKVYCQNIDGLLSQINNNVINLRGSSSSFKCQKPTCNALYTFDYYKSLLDNDLICEKCGTDIRPDIILSGENYDDDKYHSLKESLIDTHTLICLGLDIKEQALLDLIASYGDIKESFNTENKDNDEQKILVVIHDVQQELDFNEVAFCEFLVKDESGEAINRLLLALDENE